MKTNLPEGFVGIVKPTSSVYHWLQLGHDGKRFVIGEPIVTRCGIQLTDLPEAAVFPHPIDAERLSYHLCANCELTNTGS